MLLPLLHFHHISTSNTLFGTLSLCWRAVAVSQYSLYRHRLPEYALEGPYFEGCVFTQVMYDKKKKKTLLEDLQLFVQDHSAVTSGIWTNHLPVSTSATKIPSHWVWSRLFGVALSPSQQESLTLSERRFRCDKDESNQRRILQSATPHCWCDDVVAGRAELTAPRLWT